MGGIFATNTSHSSQSQQSKQQGKKKNNGNNKEEESTTASTTNSETKTILKKIENMNNFSINQSKDIGNLSTRIESLIDALQTHFSATQELSSVKDVSSIDANKKF